MKSILIITYNYPPLNSIAALRPQSFANHFAQAGYKVDVITRCWDGTENEWSDFIYGPANQKSNTYNINHNLTIHTLSANNFYYRTYKKIINTKLVKKIFLGLCLLLGYFQPELDCWFTFKKFTVSYCKKNKPDIIIVTSGPWGIIRLGNFLKQKFKAAILIADFRDVWDYESLNKNHKLTKKEHFFFRIYFLYFKKWIKNYNLITTVSDGLKQQLQKQTSKNIEIVKNGFEQNLFKNITITPSSNFIISAVGSIFPQQEWKILADGIISFCKKRKFANIQVNLIGNLLINPAMNDYLTQNLPTTVINITKRVDRKKALYYMLNSHVLVYVGWRNYKGIYSGKIFEYIASGNPILIAPKDDDVIDEILGKTNSGISVNNCTDVEAQLNNLYSLWQNGESVKPIQNIEVVKQLTREYQAQLLESYINQLNNISE